MKCSELRYGLKAPKVKNRQKSKLMASATKSVNIYKDAYHRVYGCPIVCSFDGQWVTIAGHTARVSLRRLSSMAKQLASRAPA